MLYARRLKRRHNRFYSLLEDSADNPPISHIAGHYLYHSRHDFALSDINLPRKIHFTNFQHHCPISGLLNLNDYFSESIRICNSA